MISAHSHRVSATTPSARPERPLISVVYREQYDLPSHRPDPFGDASVDRLDSALSMVRHMRDEGQFLSGRRLSSPARGRRRSAT